MRSSVDLTNQKRAKKAAASDPWEIELSSFLAKYHTDDFVTGQQLLRHLNQPVDKLNMRNYQRIGRIMKRLQWEKGRRRQVGSSNPVDGYIKPAIEASTEGKEAIAINNKKASSPKRDKPLPNPWTPAREIRYGMVYFIGGEAMGPVKIGFTSDDDPKRRLGQLQVGSHEKLELLGQVNGTIETERRIHSFLHLHKVRGEWFHREAALSVLNHLSAKASTHLPNLFADQFSEAAFTIENADGGDELEEESLAITVARHLMLDLASTFRASKVELPLALRSWLICQVDRDDPIGDLANDCKSDPSFPEVGSLTDYLTWVMGVTSNWAVTRTVVDAWLECQQVIFKLNMISIPPDPWAHKQR
jgi:hypothetical protein